MTAPSLRHCIIRYDEIALKGRNRTDFEVLAMNNLRRLLNPLGLYEIKKPRGRFILLFKENPEWPAIQNNITKVFGITSFSPAYRCELNIEDLKNSLHITLANQSFQTFGVEVKRPNKTFPLDSQAIKIQIGSFIVEKTQAKVNLKQPECWVEIEVMEDSIYYSYQRFEGPRGLPIPVSGKLMTLISGGIDSPVAAYQMMRRGCEMDFIHFHSSPFTNQASIEKVRKMVQLLQPYQGRAQLYLVPFASFQKQIVAHSPAPLRVVLYRRTMVRIAQILAERSKAQGLVTGDNLGQVASQTLHNMHCIDQATSLPILRPLISFDKMHIINQARKIGSYPISVLPDQDCCSFMVPEYPATRAGLHSLEKAEGEIALAEETDKCLQQTSLEIIGTNETESKK